MEASLFQPEAVLRIEYPSHNRLDVPVEYVRRRIAVQEIRDCRNEPLTAEAFLRRPLVRRGSILVVANDLDLPDAPERKFWLEAIRDIRGVGQLPGYRLGLYDPAQPGELIDWVSRTFGPTAKDRLAMKAAVERIQNHCSSCGGIDLQLAAYPVEG